MLPEGRGGPAWLVDTVDDAAHGGWFLLGLRLVRWLCVCLHDEQENLAHRGFFIHLLVDLMLMMLSGVQGSKWSAKMRLRGLP